MKSGIYVGCNHLEIDVFTGGLAAQERLSRKHPVDDCCRVIVVILRRHPISDTWQIDGTFNLIRKLPCELGRDFSGFISYQV